MSYVISPRRKVCTVCVLPVGGSLPAHLPAREGPPPADCAGQTLCARKQQERQRRGRHEYSMCDKNRNVHNKSKPISVHIQDRLLEQHCRILPDNLFCANSQTFISASVVARDFTPEIWNEISGCAHKSFSSIHGVMHQECVSQLRLSIRSFSCERVWTVGRTMQWKKSLFELHSYRSPPSIFI